MHAPTSPTLLGEGPPYNDLMGTVATSTSLIVRADVFVRGTGAVGLAAALALAHQGLRVALLGPFGTVGPVGNRFAGEKRGGRCCGP